MIVVNERLAAEQRRHDAWVRGEVERLKPFQHLSLDEAAHAAHVRRAAESSTGVVSMSADRTYADARAEFGRRVNEYRKLHPQVDPGTAMSRVADADPVLAEQYRSATTTLVGPGGVALPADRVAPPMTGTATPASVRFNSLVEEYRKNNNTDYATALVKMAAEHPDLAEERRREFVGGVVTL